MVHSLKFDQEEKVESGQLSDVLSVVWFFFNSSLPSQEEEKDAYIKDTRIHTWDSLYEK